MCSAIRLQNQKMTQFCFIFQLQHFDVEILSNEFLQFGIL